MLISSCQSGDPARRRAFALALVATLAVAGPSRATARRGDVPTRVHEELAARRSQLGLPALERRAELDRFALERARERAARPAGEQMSRQTPLVRGLREAGIRGVRRAKQNVQLIGGFADLAVRAVELWQEYPQAWAAVMDEEMDGIGVGAAWVPGGPLVLLTVLVVDEEQLNDLRSLERRSVMAVNALRREQGLRELVYSRELSALAREHSEDMARRGYFAHVSPEGRTLAQRLGPRVGDYVELAENIHRNRGTSDAVQTAVTGWSESAGHRANMLNPGYDETGVGVAADADGKFYLTQVFVTRPRATPGAAPTAPPADEPAEPASRAAPPGDKQGP